VPPATARVHGYLLAQRTPLAEREIRTALGLSHRATSMALVESEAWGLIERVPAPRRAGRRGPPGTAFQAIGDHWRWFGRVVEKRRLREGDPAVTAIERAGIEATSAARRSPEDRELAALRDWLADFLTFVRLFDRAAALVAGVPPRQTERAMRLLGRVSDDTVERLVALLEALPDADVLPLLDALSRLSPAAAVRATRLIAGVVRRLGS
jgi:DNA-binding transcriptional regulator GbsR (MarR family)